MTPRGHREGREPLTREKIVEKAVELIDSEGPQGLSMRRLGDALGVEAMALYHHFPNKDAILDAALAHIIEETGQGLPLEDAADWKRVMMSGPAAAGRALEKHPKAGWLFIGRQYTSAESFQMMEAPLQILKAAGFEGRDLVDAAHAIFAYTAGWYLLSSGEGGSWGSDLDEEALEAAAAVTPLTHELAPELRDWTRGMEAGLKALLDGLEAKKGK